MHRGGKGYYVVTLMTKPKTRTAFHFGKRTDNARRYWQHYSDMAGKEGSSIHKPYLRVSSVR